MKWAATIMVFDCDDEESLRLRGWGEDEECKDIYYVEVDAESYREAREKVWKIAQKKFRKFRIMKVFQKLT